MSDIYFLFAAVLAILSFSLAVLARFRERGHASEVAGTTGAAAPKSFQAISEHLKLKRQPP